MPFWHLGRPEAAQDYAEWDHEKIRVETIKCPVNQGHQRPGKRLSKLSVILPHENIAAITWTWLSDVLIQQNVVDILKRHSLTGWDVRAAKSRFLSNENHAPPPLWELVVNGWGGIAAPESGVRLIENCPACGLKLYSSPVNVGKLIDVAQWDGSDFFIVWPLPRFAFLSERAAVVLKKSGLKSFALCPMVELKFSSSNLSPGRLSYYMPEERARALGRELDIV